MYVGVQMENIICGIRDSNLKLSLAFGIGLHHAGLHERDRKTCEELFVNSKIQVSNWNASHLPRHVTERTSLCARRAL